MDDKEVLQLAADRLVLVHGEPETTEYVRRLRAIAHTLTPGQETDFSEDLPTATQRIVAEALQDQTHPCEMPGCTHVSQFDDEPYCFTHSPDSGSHVSGYSWKAGVRYMLDNDKRLASN